MPATATEVMPAVSVLKDDYRRHRFNRILFLVASGLVLVALALYSLAVGTQNISGADLLGALVTEGQHRIVLLNIRLPRVVASIAAGVALGVSGAVMQAVLRNPLASASTVGISQGAAFGAAIGIVYFGGGAVLSNTASAVSVSNPVVTALLAFAGAMVSTLVIIFIAGLRGAGPETMILAGVALSSLFSAGIALLQYFADEVQVAAIVFWTFGDLGRANWLQISLMVTAAVLSTVYFWFHAWDYNALDAGDVTARSLGISVARLRMATMVAASAATAVIVSLVGIIAFVGLIAPHIVRRVVGNDYRYVVPGSAILGAIVLLAGDTFSRTIIAPVLLPVGAITSFLGAPLFMYIIFKNAPRR